MTEALEATHPLQAWREARHVTRTAFIARLRELAAAQGDSGFKLSPQSVYNIERRIHLPGRQLGRLIWQATEGAVDGNDLYGLPRACPCRKEPNHGDQAEAG